MLCLAVVVLVLWMVWQVRRETRFSLDNVITAAIIAVPSGIIFSRLLHVWDLWGYYSQHPGEIIGTQGLTIYGAILGATIGVWVYSKVRRFPFGRFADLAAPGIILAQAIGRVGCLFNGCCYGTETDVPWSISYVYPGTGPFAVSVHPTQVYEIIFNLAVFGVLWRLKDRLKPEGSLFMVYLALYALWRFGIGFMRGENTDFFLGMSQAQIVSIVVLLITLPQIVWKTRWAGKQAESAVAGTL
jgi:phosphatidylglycerol:prolipoprotein diacylglycerol transferase